MKQLNNETMKHTTFAKIFNKKTKTLVRQYQPKNVENPCIYQYSGGEYFDAPSSFSDGFNQRSRLATSSNADECREFL
jgi:hypothetical protein